MNIRNFHSSFKNMCFRERRGESLQVYKPVSLSLRYISFILRGLRARLWARIAASFSFWKHRRILLLQTRSQSISAGSWTDDFGRFCISFRLFLNSIKPLSFSFLSINTFFSSFQPLFRQYLH